VANDPDAFASPAYDAFPKSTFGLSAAPDGNRHDGDVVATEQPIDDPEKNDFTPAVNCDCFASRRTMPRKSSASDSITNRPLTLTRAPASQTSRGKSESRRIVNVSRKFDTTGSGVSSFTPRALVLNVSTLSWTCAFVNSAPSRLTVVDGHRCCRDARRLYTASRHLNGMFADTKPHESIPFELVLALSGLAVALALIIGTRGYLGYQQTDEGHATACTP
jgi:hypothetical protein